MSYCSIVIHHVFYCSIVIRHVFYCPPQVNPYNPRRINPNKYDIPAIRVRITARVRIRVSDRIRSRVRTTARIRVSADVMNRDVN